MDRRVVLVTGTSSGIGRQAVHDLRDCHVIATARRQADIKDLEGDHVETAALDVTKEASLQRVVAQAIADHGRIDALVNNAGYGISLPIEETPLERMHAMFDVNVFGLHRLTQEVLPHMRRRGQGRIVNVSSIAGHIGFPMIGAYCASKFAVRGYSQALRAEVRPFGIHVSLIEPGRIRTGFSDRAHKERGETVAEPAASPYAPIYRKWRKSGPDGGADPRVIGRRIHHACTARRPRFHYLAPWDAKTGDLLNRMLPDRAVNAALDVYFRH